MVDFGNTLLQKLNTDVIIWGYQDNENIRDNLEKEKNELIKYVDQSFLKTYCVLDSISKLKSTQKHKMADYLVLLLLDEVEHTLEMLKSCGYDITDEQLFSLLMKESKEKKNNRLVGSDDVKRKFKSAMDEFLERTGSL